MTDARTIDLTDELGIAKERRRKSRLLISTPVRLKRVAGTDQDFEEFTTTVNLSSHGILIETDNPNYVHGMKVGVVVPFEETPGVLHREQEGTVVRVNELRGGHRAVAIALEQSLSDEHTKPVAEKSHRGPHKAASADRHKHPASELKLPLVLVLAEESNTRDSIKIYLSGEGYEVIAVGSAVDARNALKNCTPALVIAEVEGEGMPGYELCIHCKETPNLKSVPVMLMTNSAYPSDYAKAHSLGAVVCMAKPYRRERLGHVVRLLAPPLHADKKTAPMRPADASRRTLGAKPKGSASITVR